MLRGTSSNLRISTIWKVEEAAKAHAAAFNEI